MAFQNRSQISRGGTEPPPETGRFSPSQSLLDTVMAETVGMAMHHAVTAQNNARMVTSAAVTATCARLINTPTAPAGTNGDDTDANGNDTDGPCPPSPWDPNGVCDPGEKPPREWGSPPHSIIQAAPEGESKGGEDPQSLVERAQDMIKNAALMMERAGVDPDQESSSSSGEREGSAEWCAATK